MAEKITDILTLQSLVQQLVAQVQRLEAENASLRAALALLQQENQELRNRLQKNSRNSHKPPSSDGPRKKPALPKPKSDKVGGQVGHEGKTLEMVAKVDHTIVHHASHCSCCQRAFHQQEATIIGHKRQVFDLPDPRLEITEHQIGVITCCGQAHLGTFPLDVAAPVQYGHRVKAMVTLLNTDYRVPIDKISTLFKDLYNYQINDNTIIEATKKCYDALHPVELMTKEAVLGSPVANFDETGMRVAGKLQWLHTACNALFCYLFVHPKRGKEALQDEKSVIKDFTGWAVHDCWASYFDFDNCLHALCNAHILRELTALIDQGSQWAAQMHSLLLELYEQSQTATVVVVDPARWEAKYQQICQLADTEEPPPIKKARGKPKNSKGRNLLNRLNKHQAAILAFAFNEQIPFTNNVAERDIRHVKVKQRVSMSFRTFKGAEIYARIQGFVITTRKQKQNTFKELCRLLNGESYQFSYT